MMILLMILPMTPPLGASDHVLLKFHIHCPPSNIPSQYSYRDYNNGNYNTMRHELNIDWNTALSACNDIHSKWNLFKKVCKNTAVT